MSGEIWAAACAQVGGFFSTLEDVEIRSGSGGVLGITGAPFPDFNMCLAQPAPGALEFVRAAAARVTERGVPALFFVPAALAAGADVELTRLGLTRVALAPLMVYSGDIAPPGGDFDLLEATGSPELLDSVADLMSAAFKLDRRWVGQWMSPAAWSVESPFRAYVASRKGRPMSTVSVSGPGPLAGIWSMATPPELQRRGAGRAALLGAMRTARDSGARTFYLMATPEGKPLYVSVGFRTVEEFPLYLAESAAPLG